MSIKVTTIDFIKKAQQTHGQKYDYSRVNYEKAKKEVEIICPIHGVFTQQPIVHYRSGCPKCGKIKRAYNRRKTIEQFIEKAQEVHGKKYDYSESNYIDYYNVPVQIFCNNCQEYFWQKPRFHLTGSNCPRCVRRDHSTKISLPFHQFKERANNLHNHKYTYVKESYINTINLVTIICPQHGEFSVIACDHINKSKLLGCPSCRKYKFEDEFKTILDFYNIKYVPQKSFIECRYKNPLKFDFYLPDYNICIECHGSQHYHETKFFGGQQGFQTRLIRDQIKRDYCVENDIVLIEIPYWERANLENYLIQKLKELYITI